MSDDVLLRDTPITRQFCNERHCNSVQTMQRLFKQMSTEITQLGVNVGNKIDGLNSALYVDNGGESVQTKITKIHARLKAQDQWQRGVMRVFWIVLTAYVTVVVGLVVSGFLI